MGRGRQKAKHTKIARELKYDTYNVNFGALEKELGHHEDDPYVDWFVPLREEARAVYLNVARQLAAVRAASGELDDAIRLYLRLLEREPYDEAAHVDLVRALSRVGRHGDARRRYQHYADRMRELDLEPRSFAAAVGGA